MLVAKFCRHLPRRSLTRVQLVASAAAVPRGGFRAPGDGNRTMRVGVHHASTLSLHMQPVSSNVESAVRRMDAAISMYAGLRGDPATELLGAIDEHARATGLPPASHLASTAAVQGAFIEAHAILVMLYALGTGATPSTPAIVDHIAVLDAWRASPPRGASRRSVSLCAAAHMMIRGHMRAATAALELSAREAPHDILILRALHDAYFFLGDAARLRGSIASRVCVWDPSMPEYFKMLGMLAFGHEENNDYARAEETAEAALAGGLEDPWALHALVHVCEMQSRVNEGKRLLSETRDAWEQARLFDHHLLWHWSVFNLEETHLDAALNRFDTEMTGPKRAPVLNLADDASLVWRATMQVALQQATVTSRPAPSAAMPHRFFEACGVPRADASQTRWHEMQHRWKPYTGQYVMAYNDVFRALMLACTGATAELLDHMQQWEAYVAAHEARAAEPGTIPVDNVRTSKEVGLPVARALIQSVQGDHAAAAAGLLATRSQWPRLGGSHAQRDVFEQTLIYSAIMNRDYPLAKELLAERVTLRFASPASWNLYSYVLGLAGEPERAADAQNRAFAIGLRQGGPTY